MRSLPLLICLWLTLCAGAWPALAQDTAPTAPLLSPEAQVSVLTVYPGDAVYSQFGHTAIRIHDPAQHYDVVFNYGVFDFTDPLFVPKFVYGQLDYMLAAAPTDAVLTQAQHEQRAVVEQVLDLTSAEKDAVYLYLAHNAQPENREYRYRFLDDNCSTRVRDVFEDVLGAGLSWGPRLGWDEAAPDEGQTFREYLLPYLAGEAWLGLGIDLVLGVPADRAVSPREAMFLPLPLMAALDGATVKRDGNLRVLVSETRRLGEFGAADPDLPERRSGLWWEASAWPWPTGLMWAAFAAAVTGTIVGAKRHDPRLTRWGRAFDAAVLAGAGLAGAVVLFMWVGTEHDVTGPNWNLLWAWPTHLVAAVCIVGRWGGRWFSVYLLAAAVAAGATAAGWLWWPQPLPGALLPMVLVIVMRAAVAAVSSSKFRVSS